MTDLYESFKQYKKKKLSLDQFVSIMRQTYDSVHIFKDYEIFKYLYNNESLTDIYTSCLKYDCETDVYKIIYKFGIVDEQDFLSFCLKHMKNIESMTQLYDFSSNEKVAVFLLNNCFDEFLKLCKKFDVFEHIIFEFSKCISKISEIEKKVDKLIDSMQSFNELQSFFCSKIGKISFKKFLINFGSFNKLEEICCSASEKEFSDLHSVASYYFDTDDQLKSCFGILSSLYNHQLFDESQKLVLIETLKNNEFAQNKLKSLLNNNLLNAYDFDALKMYLSKTEKKNLFNI